MVTTREWWKRGIQAWGASALVPVAVLVAVVVLAIGGGVGGVRRLGQLFGGPTVPSPVQAAGRVDVGTERQAGLPHVPARVLAGAGPAARAVRATPVTGPRRGTGGTGGGSDRQSTAHRSPGSSRPVGSTPTQPKPPITTTKPPPPPPPPPPPQPPKTITRRLGDAVNRVVAPVPVVGPTASGAIDAVVTTVDRVLPLPPPSQVLSRVLGSPG
jgi:hypothetical protein